MSSLASFVSDFNISIRYVEWMIEIKGYVNEPDELQDVILAYNVQGHQHSNEFVNV